MKRNYIVTIEAEPAIMPAIELGLKAWADDFTGSIELIEEMSEDDMDEMLDQATVEIRVEGSFGRRLV